MNLDETLNQINVQVIGIDELDVLAQDLASDAWMPACDTETEYRQALEVDGIPGQVRVISFAVKREDGSEAAYVVDLRDTPAERVNEVMSKLDFLGFNANFDEHALQLVGISVQNWYDVMLADTVTRAGRTGIMWYRSLAQLAKVALGIELDGKGSVQLSYNLTDDLTDDQIRYAGYDAVVTRRVGEWVRNNVEAANLALAVELENGSRPFINAMMINGVPFQLDEYLDSEIAAKREIVADSLAKLAELTESRPLEEAPQLALFEHAAAAHNGEGDARPVPSWNPNSKPELIEALNKWASDEVKAYTKKVLGEERLLLATDSLRKDDVKQIKSPIVTALLALKKAAKEVTTYGADLRKYHRNGRFFSRYKQGGLVSTGRLASFNFNAQNLSKGMLPHMKAEEGNIFVYGDISQAELRFAAHLSKEQDMIDAFTSGEDFHTATVRVMNPGVDVDEIAESDPKRMKDMRTSAKAVNFGLAYGMGPALLAKNLTVSGVDTDKETAQGYLDAYFAARPKMQEWLEARDASVIEFSRNLPQIDWQASFSLYSVREDTEIKRRALKKKLGYMPSGLEVAAHVWPDGPDGIDEDDALSDEELQEFWASQASKIDWAFSYEGAVLLTATGAPLEFYSYTPSGRRRCFNVSMGNERNDKFSGFVTAVVLEMCNKPKAAGKAYLAEFCEQHNIVLPADQAWRSDRMRARVDTVKAFEGRDGKALKLELIRGAVRRFGFQALEPMFRRAAAGCVRGLKNAHRNHPIQGAVADVVEHAFAKMIKELPEGARPIISVHDSVTIECRKEDADAVARLLHDSVMDAMAIFCKTCPAKVDVDVRTSLSDDDVVYEFDPAVSSTS